MKDALLNLLVFLLVFVVVAAIFLVYYHLSLLLVPGGKGLVFANPYAAALLPALLGALVAAQFRSVRHPGRFAFTWMLQAAAFYLLLALALPLAERMPPARAVDDTPTVPHRFLPLEDGSLLLSTKEHATVLIPAEGTMSVSPRTQYDALNHRFVFAEGEPRVLGSTGPERRYFQYTDALVSLQTDLLAVYSVLRESAVRQPFVYWFQVGAIAWLFLGFYVFLSLRTWPLVQLVLVLVLIRLAIVFLVYCFWSLPALVDLWLPGAANAWVRTWGPIGFIGVAAATLFFMTLLSKPHRRTALS